jgi:hypothetical protein
MGTAPFVFVAFSAWRGGLRISIGNSILTGGGSVLWGVLPRALFHFALLVFGAVFGPWAFVFSTDRTGSVPGVSRTLMGETSSKIWPLA